ncbi:Nicotinate-nucleotide adenylyltransferase [hydrothermal vent metagenome]|uniref:Nicotinate-nucleotide adenylyltransferase n=1 Tax=hydrothermal vent metagenome TaxID=652676 RepID=A0A3B1DPQ0_9ZZZZ
MRIGIFGGTFNPIHIGHLVAAQTVQEKLRLDKVVFVPSYLPPHKSSKNIIAAKDRYQMVQQAIKGNINFSVSDFEVKRIEKSYSIETVNFLETQFPRRTKIFFIIGEDGLATLSTWRCIDELLSKVTFAVVHRPGCEGRFSEIKIQAIPMAGLDISSSEIRKRIKANKKVQYILPQSVWQYIEKKKLYKRS